MTAAFGYVSRRKPLILGHIKELCKLSSGRVSTSLPKCIPHMVFCGFTPLRVFQLSDSPTIELAMWLSKMRGREIVYLKKVPSSSFQAWSLLCCLRQRHNFSRPLRLTPITRALTRG